MTKARILADFVSDSDEFADGQIHVSEVVGAAATDSVTAKSSATGSSMIATGTTQQRDGSPSAGMLRFNSTDTSFEGYNGSAWGAIGGGSGGATGGGSDAVFYENDQVVTAAYTIPADQNAMSTGPITINDGVVVTVSTGARFVVI